MAVPSNGNNNLGCMPALSATRSAFSKISVMAGKRLVVCLDGTWNTPDQKDRGQIRPSNVVKMARSVAPVAPDGTVQVVFYDRGVGTGWGLDRLTGGAFGQGVTRNIEDAYRFLVNNYSNGDEVYLFGFSRGSYTARSTAGMIRNSGLLKKHHADRFPEAYALYRDVNVHPNDDEAAKFRLKYAWEPRIKVIGVWDTVGALGVPVAGLRWLTRGRHEFHDVTLSSYIDNAFHALAIDEKRGPFAPTLWEAQGVEGQKLEQVWFAGVHTNVGGGYEDSGLSDIAFSWMLNKAASCGLAIIDDYVVSQIHPDIDGELRESKKGFYKIAKGHVRTIGVQTNGHESVHNSAVMRSESDRAKPWPYRPEKLLQYLAGDDRIITDDG